MLVAGAMSHPQPVQPFPYASPCTHLTASEWSTGPAFSSILAEELPQDQGEVPALIGGGNAFPLNTTNGTARVPTRWKLSNETRTESGGILADGLKLDPDLAVGNRGSAGVLGTFEERHL